MIRAIKKILKKTPVYSLVFRYRHFKKKTVPKYKKKLDEKKRMLDLYLLEKYKKRVFKEPPIEVVNFNANDICNSKCVMCNIWEQKQGFEISPEELRNVLMDPLFKNVRHVGITGGEPTLRKDLALLYEAVIEAIPGIEGLSIITNAIKHKDVIARIEDVNATCEKYNKPFSIMVSLDGYGKVHDDVRGRKGNFESVVKVMEHFRSGAARAIPLNIGCTISKVNVWDIDELLDYLKDNQIYGRFRVAEFIKRLYNDDNSDVIRNFDEDETYHLILFFYKLIFSFEKNETYKRTYKSIINILAGGKRLIGCPYHAKGVVLSSKGELAYCAPKSKIIGNALKENALDLYKSNISERNRIIDHDCDNCIHDYHAPITYSETIREREYQKWKTFLKLNSEISFSKHKSVRPLKIGKFQIFITGWYGTETVGDKAILGGIVQELYEQYGTDISIIISSLYPLITIRTIKELDIEATIIAAYTKEFIGYAKGSDIIIIGGGPLMDLEELALPLTEFKLAKEGKGKTIIYGCGLGPLTDKKFIEAVKQILNLADEIKLRDKKSIEMAKDWLLKDIPIELSGDPAKKYLQRYTGVLNEVPSKKILTCFLREWTYEYYKSLSFADFLTVKNDFEASLAAFIKRKAEDIGAVEIVFDHMHNFVVGNDDRDYSRYFIKTYFADYETIPVRYNKYLSTVESVAKSMKTSAHNICMRFHSVLFADTLGTSFTAIDYTMGGKIYGYLGDNNSLDNLINIHELINQKNESSSYKYFR